MSRLTNAGWLCLAGVVLVQAQSPRFSAPLSGHIYDPPTRSIRPLTGVPGGAWLGPPVLTGVDFASVAPNGQYALGFRDGQAVVAVFGREVAETPIAGALADAERAVWARDGSTVVLSSNRHVAQRITGLPDSPWAGEQIDIGDAGAVLAVDGSSGAIVAGSGAGPDGGLYLVSETAPPVWLMAMKEPGAAVFSRDGQVLYVAERSTGEVFTLRNLSDGAQITSLVAAQDALEQPAGLAVDESRLYVAGVAARLVRVYDATTARLMKDIPLEATPTGIEPISDRGVFLIAGRNANSQPVVILDIHAQSVFYVPAGGEE